MKQIFNFITYCRRLKLLPILVGLLLPHLSQAQSPNIVISQVYGGGGNSGATYNQDFVELFNRSPVSQFIGGYTLQYGAANPSGATRFAVSTVIPAGTAIAPGGYYLIALNTASVSAGVPLPTPDFTPGLTFNLNASAGKVALVASTTPLSSTNSATGPMIIDFVGYGTLSGTNTVTTYEGNAPAPALSATLAALRANGGCSDTNQNGTDFTAAVPVPRNSTNSRPLCTDQVLVVNPSALTFSAATGQTASTATYVLAGFNLNSNATITISSNNSAVLVSTTGAAGSFASTVTVSTTANGRINQTVTVQFTAPTAVGITNATISNSDGTHAASVAVTGSAVMAYTWNGSSSSYSNPTSWTPTRTTPLSNSDILVFDGAVTANPTVNLDFTATQTIGQLLFSNNVAAVLSTDGDRTLTLDNNLPGDDLVIGAGSAVTVANNSTAGSSALTIALTNTETAVVGGTLIFTGYMNSANGRHTLQAASAGAIQFLSGSTFRATDTYTTANPFGSSTANSVIFRNGARYEQFGGSTPFGSNTPVVTTFEPASYFLFGVTSAFPALTNRIYGTLAYNISGTSTASVNGPATIQGDLIALNGTVNINLTGALILQGNMQVNGTASLTFGANSANTIVQMNGTAAQTISTTTGAASAPVFGPNATLAINNTAGVTLVVPITIPGNLQLTTGLLTTTVANPLILPSTVTISAGSDASFVNGPVLRPVNAAGTYTFPIGKSVSFRPVTLNVSAQSGTTYYRAEQFEGNPGQNVTGSGLTRVSIFRSFTITPFASAANAIAGTVTQPSNFAGTVTMSFGSNDGVTDPSQLVIAKRPNSGSAWTSAGYTASAGTSASGIVTSNTFTTFSDFALGFTGTDPTINPLPVVLTSFGATRQTSGAAQVRWATASEQHSSYFEVQRSLDGSAFIAVDRVAAAGTTTQAHTYASLDTQAPATQLYYRLRQVDTDGTETFSPVVSLAATAVVTSLALYPNPAHDHLILAAAAREEVQIIDLTGRVLQTTKLSASGQLNVELLPTGTYLLRAPLGGQPRVLRFTKE